MQKITSTNKVDPPRRQVANQLKHDKTDPNKDYRLSHFNFYESKKKKKPSSRSSSQRSTLGQVERKAKRVARKMEWLRVKRREKQGRRVKRREKQGKRVKRKTKRVDSHPPVVFFDCR